jgi:hypothetical protein
MLFVLPFWLLLLLVRTQRTAQYNFIKTLAFCFIILLTLAPWTIRNFQKYDRLTLVRPVPHTAFPNLDDLDAQRQRIESGFEDTTDYLKKNPLGSDDDKIGNILGNYIKHPIRSMQYLFSELGHFWALYPDRLDTQSKSYQQKIQRKDHRLVSLKSFMWDAAVVASIAVMLPVFALALFGLIVSRPVDRQKLLLLFTVLGMSVGYSLIYAEVRYRIPIEPYVLMFSAAGIAKVSEFARSAKEKGRAHHNRNNMQSTSALHHSWENHLTGTKK